MAKTGSENINYTLGRIEASIDHLKTSQGNLENKLETKLAEVTGQITEVKSSVEVIKNTRYGGQALTVLITTLCSVALGYLKGVVGLDFGGPLDGPK